MSRRTIRRPVTVAAAAFTLVAAGGFVGPSPASAHWACGRKPPPDRDSTGGHYTRGVTEVMRSGSSTDCGGTGWTDADSPLDYHCYALNIHGYETWTYVVNTAGVGGWIRDDRLNDGGSRVWCPNQTV
ncbi:hypothetical protein GA0070620_0148 [Micromonospora krabiensis]|uniref:Peptidase inhibitor family I36 n=1 Tax=Micromonospora krabiensis TaxID=307121 RepID=A0A1C3MWK0_9ACTN|nr:hypothetical protein GA0070620_0148 [Micromonospora krabiensis]